MYIFAHARVCACVPSLSSERSLMAGTHGAYGFVLICAFFKNPK